jgi:alpha-beta hydrolase superfamily lysophospholipase
MTRKSLFTRWAIFVLFERMRSNRTIQGGFHELQHEPDGVKEKFTDECIAWAEEHFPSAAEGANQSQARL